eukprot:5103149-Amphidinium_carterae.1
MEIGTLLTANLTRLEHKSACEALLRANVPFVVPNSVVAAAANGARMQILIVPNFDSRCVLTQSSCRGKSCIHVAEDMAFERN